MSCAAMQEKEALSTVVFECGSPPEILIFVLTFLLRMPIKELVAGHLGDSLSRLTDLCVERYAALRFVKRTKVPGWFTGLRRRMKEDGTGDRRLRDCFPRAVTDEAARLAEWRKQVLKKTVERCGQRSDLVSFRHRFGLTSKKDIE
jgi:hypothetical protein